MVPDGWHETKLGNLFRSRRARGEAGLPTLSVTLSEGLVRRDSLDRKMDTNLAPEQHLLVRKGDIAYNMMRMWQGASGLADHDALVSPAYVVLEPTEEIDPLFASYFFKTPRMIYLFWAYSHGLTNDRLRLYFDDFSLIPVTVPNLREQGQIAQLLTTWDSAIDVVERLIANGRLQRRALVQELLTAKTRVPGSDNAKWRVLPFEQIASPSREKFDPKKNSEDRNCIELEHIESETGRLLGRCKALEQDSIKSVFTAGNVLFGKLRPYLRKFAFASFSGVCSTEIWVFKAKPICLPRYLFYLVQSSPFVRAASVSAGSKMPRAEWQVVKDTLFHIPNIEEQAAIVEVLDKAESLLHTYQTDIQTLRREKFALMQQLLASGRRSKIEEKVE
jgi:type I restriction enzyme S subunit